MSATHLGTVGIVALLAASLSLPVVAVYATPPQPLVMVSCHYSSIYAGPMSTRIRFHTMTGAIDGWATELSDTPPENTRYNFGYVWFNSVDTLEVYLDNYHPTLYKEVEYRYCGVWD